MKRIFVLFTLFVAIGGHADPVADYEPHLVRFAPRLGPREQLRLCDELQELSLRDGTELVRGVDADVVLAHLTPATVAAARRLGEVRGVWPSDEGVDDGPPRPRLITLDKKEEAVDRPATVELIRRQMTTPTEEFEYNARGGRVSAQLSDVAVRFLRGLRAVRTVHEDPQFSSCTSAITGTPTETTDERDPH